MMKTNLVRIGNSKGVRLPKAVIEQAQLTDELQLEVGKGVVVLRAIRSVRNNWEDDAASCRAASADELSDWDVVAGDFSGECK
jgi:antitoxin MazE